METKKETVTAWFPGGIGTIEISTKRAEQIKRLQRIIRERNENDTKTIYPVATKKAPFSKDA